MRRHLVAMETAVVTRKRTVYKMASGGGRTVETSDPPGRLRASVAALDFLSSIGSEELCLSLFPESLSSFSDSGAELGAFTVDVRSASYQPEGRGEEVECFLLHIRSGRSFPDVSGGSSFPDVSGGSSLPDVSGGSSITAYISSQLETLEQQHHEYLQLGGNSLDKKTEMRKRGDRIEIRRVITEGQQIRQETKSYELGPLSGVVSEATNLLLMRLMARRRIAQNLEFLTFDAEMNLCISSYRALGSRPQLIGTDTVEVYGLERAILSDDVPIAWQCCFLPDGHLSSRVQVGSPLTIRLTEMPILAGPEEEDPKPQCDKTPLPWEEDAQLYPAFLERKEELTLDHETYLRGHPDMAALLGDFVQLLLLRKPQDVLTFAADFFGPFSSGWERGETFRSATISSPFHDESK